MHGPASPNLSIVSLMRSLPRAVRLSGAYLYMSEPADVPVRASISYTASKYFGAGVISPGDNDEEVAEDTLLSRCDSVRQLALRSGGSPPIAARQSPP
jgi:hypothetical protein